MNDSPRARPVREHAGPVLLLCAASLALHWQAVFTSRVFFRRDVLMYWYPLVETFVRVIAQGAWPLWDPFESFGLPMLADPGSQVVYPTTWLNLLFLPHTVYKLMVVGHAAFTGVGAYLLARRLSLGTTGAVAAGLAWMSSGPFVSLAGLYHHYCGAAWLPWVLVAYEGVLERPSVRTVLALSAAAAGQVFAGSGDMLVMSALAMAGRGLLFLLENRGAGTLGLKAAALRLAALALVVLPATACLSAVQLWPTVVHLQSTYRAAMGKGDNLFWSLHPGGLIDLVLPRLAEEIWSRTRLYEGREPFLESVYVGAAFLALMWVGVFGSRRARFFAFMAAFFVLLALGRHTPLLPALLQVPPFSLFRYPVKYMAPAALFFALLAGSGADLVARTALDARAARRALVATAVAALLALGALACVWWWPFPVAPVAPGSVTPGADHASALPRLATAAAALAAAAVLLALRMRRAPTHAPRWATALAALGALDLGIAAQPLNPLAAAELATHRPPLLDHLEGQKGFRVLGPDPPFSWINAQLVRGPAGWKPEASFALGLQEMLCAPTGGRWGLFTSYDTDFTGLADQTVLAASTVVRRGATSDGVVRLLRLGNVSHVVEIEPSKFPMLPEVTRARSVFESPLRLLRVPDPLPRAYVVGRALPAPEMSLAFQAITDPLFSPEREVVLSEETAMTGARTAGQASVRSWRADRVVIEAVSPGPGFLVLVQTYDPGWQATVGGRPEPVRRANVLFQAVAIPAGGSVVELVYRPRSALVGFVTSLIAWTLAAVVIAWPRLSLLADLRRL